MAFALVSASRSLALHNSGATCLVRTTKNPSCRLHATCVSGCKSTFASGSLLCAFPLFGQPLSHFRVPVNIKSSRGARCGNRTASVSIRCEQSTKGGNSLDIWLGRVAMVGFAVAITVEIATGKGLLENFGLTTPLPTVALGVTGLVGVLTAVFIFQSASKS